MAGAAGRALPPGGQGGRVAKSRGGHPLSELLRIGDEAPLFRAAASDGETYDLGDVLAGKHVALVFYPGNNTSG